MMGFSDWANFSKSSALSSSITSKLELLATPKSLVGTLPIKEEKGAALSIERVCEEEVMKGSSLLANIY